MATSSLRRAAARRRALRDILLYGLCGGVLIAGLKLAEYRFLVVDHSLEIYGGLIAALFAAVGILLGMRWTRTGTAAVPLPGASAPPAVPFVRDEGRVAALGITPRELEILELIAAGLSNREIAERLFVSENTVKRLWDNPLTNAALTFIEPFPVGVVIAAVSAAILRKR